MYFALRRHVLLLPHAPRSLSHSDQRWRARSLRESALAFSGAELATTPKRARSRLATTMATVYRTTLASLPVATLREVLLRLPVDERARAAAVCRTWRDLLSDCSLWTRLDLSEAGGVAFTRVTDAMLRGAVAKAGGGLTALSVGLLHQQLTHDALVDVCAANSGALTELRGSFMVSVAHVEALLRAAPLLRECHVAVFTSGYMASRLLRNEPPFRPLRIAGLMVEPPWPDDEAAMQTFTADWRASATQVSHLCLHMAPRLGHGVFDALVDVALERRLETIELIQLQSSIPITSLFRLLASKSLTVLNISGHVDTRTLSVSGLQSSVALLAAAVRANDALFAVYLEATGILGDASVAETLISALSSHPSLAHLCICEDPVAVADRARIGASLGVLVSANSPHLRGLDLSGCDLDDEGLDPLVDALQFNTHLVELSCFGNNVSEAFALHRLRPAILANTGLKALTLVGPFDDEDAPVLQLLEQLVQARVR